MSNGITPDEIRGVTKKALLLMQTKVGEWSIRDTLRKLTAFDFWKGEEYLTLDNATAYQVIDAALEVIKDGPDQVVNDIYEVVYFYER